MATTQKYIESVGRRKTSVARIRLHEASKNSYTINDRDIKDYFPTEELREIVTSAVKIANAPKHYQITIHVRGGGIHSQAEAVRQGIARSFIASTPETKAALKKEGYLSRDSRAKERRKFGLKKARKAPQWSKR